MGILPPCHAQFHEGTRNRCLVPHDALYHNVRIAHQNPIAQPDIACQSEFRLIQEGMVIVIIALLFFADSPRGMPRTLLNSAQRALPVDEAMRLVDSPQVYFLSYAWPDEQSVLF
jgi:hypothetical protein